jgi:hypothetical protein
LFFFFFNLLFCLMCFALLFLFEQGYLEFCLSSLLTCWSWVREVCSFCGRGTILCGHTMIWIARSCVVFFDSHVWIHGLLCYFWG